MTNNNDETIKYIADMLQLQGDEDLALELEEAWARMKHELERVKGIASRRLDRIAQLQHDVAVLEDKLEDTRSELKYEKGISAHQRSLAGQLALELAQLEDDPRRLEDFDNDAELEASLARIRELDELGRERIVAGRSENE